ncbi:hypothetical protein Bbelb_288830 [Branchiostoma belcheri]|nr:hypothetical protein Bbelb_288830 [Branchiostoma belcheri]
MSTAPGNVSSIDEERSAAEATDIADNNTEPVYHNSCVNQLEHNPGDNHGSSGPPVDASDLEDTDRAPASNIQHPDTTGSLDDTIINPDTGDLDISDNIEAYANERSNEPDTPDCEDPNKRVLTNPMYEELPDTSTQQAEDNVSNEHDLQGPSNTNDSKGDKKLQKLQSQPNMKSLQPNVMYGGYIPNQGAGGTFCGRVQDAVRDFPRESAGRPPGECDTFCGRVRYVQRESANIARRLPGERRGLACPTVFEDWTGSGCNIKGAGGFC